MTIYLVTTNKGFGKGLAETEAISSYEHSNGKLRGEYTLDKFEAESPDDVSVDLNFGNWHTVNYAKHLSSVVCR